MELSIFVAGVIIIWASLFILMASVSPFSLMGGLSLIFGIITFIWYGIYSFDKTEVKND